MRSSIPRRVSVVLNQYESGLNVRSILVESSDSGEIMCI